MITRERLEELIENNKMEEVERFKNKEKMLNE